MALRDQPYLPLYVQDIMTDEKLNECCAATHGIFIKGIMCLMHKSETYGKILLKQKHKQTESKERNFALMLANHLPYSVDVIFAALTELIDEKVCHYEGDYLVQKRMVRDHELSTKRAASGQVGGIKGKIKNMEFAKANNEAKEQANTEFENVYGNEYENKGKEIVGEKTFKIPTEEEVHEVMAFRSDKSVEPQFEAAQFIHFYESNGWKVGNQPMQNWHASAKKWIDKKMQEAKLHNKGHDTSMKTDNPNTQKKKMVI